MVTYSMYSDIGNRENNEDSVGKSIREDAYCFVLADGLGGHGGGETASALAVQSVLELFDSVGPDPEFLGGCFTAAQDAVLREQNRSRLLADMKTTLVVLTITAGGIRWGHIGDSRLYAFRSGKLKSHTPDHSVPQMLVASGEIKEQDIRFHEDRNRLLRVIGMEWGRRSYDLSETVPVRKKQAFLLCSDGFWELILEKQMQKTLKSAASVQEWMDSMVGIVKEQGAGKNMDNNSAIAVWVTQD